MPLGLTVFSYFQLDCSPYELERLHTKVTSLCNRIEQIECHNARDRLAQSGTVPPISSTLLQKAVLKLKPVENLIQLALAVAQAAGVRFFACAEKEAWSW